jgi:hypothetical protein
MMLLTFIIQGLFDISFRSRADDDCGGVLVDCALALGALCQLLLRDLAAGLSVSLIVSPALSGVGFPIVGMNAFAQTGVHSCRCVGTWRCCSVRRRAVTDLASAKPFAFWRCWRWRTHYWRFGDERHQQAPWANLCPRWSR